MARYEQYTEKNRLKNGAVVWAYTFELNDTKEKVVINRKPIKGRLSVSSRVSDDDGRRAFNEAKTPRFFVPFKKASDSEYAWSRAVNFHTRCYADTEEEAVDGYNGLIQQQINWHQKKICELTKLQK